MSVSTHWLLDRLCARIYRLATGLCVLSVVHDGRTCRVVKGKRARWGTSTDEAVQPRSTATARDFAGTGLCCVVSCRLDCP